ncbi:unnamed protein product [Peniophora sp. CBMAI 1063]|nr:unnamed protein product [Peniophora sp. CBMAI 1063]
MSRPNVILREGALVDGVVYTREFRFLVGQATCAPAINYLADAVERVFFRTMHRQNMSIMRSNWPLVEAGLSRAFVFHMAVITEAPIIVLLVVLVYLDRMQPRLVIPPDCLNYGLVCERLLLGAWILAFQTLFGVPNNRSMIWANATRLFSPHEVDQTIDEIKRVLDNDLSFAEIDMHVHCSKLVEFYDDWSDQPMLDVREPVEQAANHEMSRQSLHRYPTVQTVVPGMSLTGGVERRSVRLVCRSSTN